MPRYVVINQVPEATRQAEWLAMVCAVVGDHDHVVSTASAGGIKQR